ncbi:hypothetical protein V6U71_20500 [Sphingopyxis sp. J-6]|uniref:hypothetical protein n=1 Tax=Sphingopyxis sp. J-6 TaxID=3122054 RepID=UPI003984503A
MVDRPPPSRFSVVERGGRLVVIDRETGQTPLSAAERMDIYDRNLGVEPIRPARTSATPDMSAAARAESGLSARPAPVQKAAASAPAAAESSQGRMAAAIAERNKRPWNPTPNDRPALKSTSAPAASRPAQAAGGGRKTIVTGKWWDAKGPRTIELGPKGQQVLSGGFVTVFFVALFASIVALFIAPVIFFVGAFLLFRFGSNVLGPIGAGIVDKAIAERN